MATNVSRDSILDAMVAKVSALKPATGEAMSSTLVVRSVGRIMGRLDSTNEVFQRGVAGRCPAVLVGVDTPTRRIRTTIGRRVDRVESGFKAVVVIDKEKSRDARTEALAVCESVRYVLGARRLGLEIQPLLFAGEATELDNEQMLAVAVKFTSKHRVDYTHTPVDEDEMKTVFGEIVFPEDENGVPGALRGEVSVIYP